MAAAAVDMWWWAANCEEEAPLTPCRADSELSWCAGNPNRAAAAWAAAEWWPPMTPLTALLPTDGVAAVRWCVAAVAMGLSILVCLILFTSWATYINANTNIYYEGKGKTFNKKLTLKKNFKNRQKMITIPFINPSDWMRVLIHHLNYSKTVFYLS